MPGDKMKEIVLQNLNSKNCHNVIKQILQKTDYDLIDYRLAPLKENSGLLGEHSILTISIAFENKSQVLTFFVKSMPMIESQRIFAIESGAFYKEAQMFKKIVPMFRKNGISIIEPCLPMCYESYMMEYLIFDNLSAKGYATFSSRDSLKFDAVKSAFNSLAIFHASCLILEEKLTQQYGRQYRMIDDFQLEFKETFYSSVSSSVRLIEAAKKGIVTHIDLFPDAKSKITEEIFKERACKTIDRYVEFVAPSNQFRNTICHGDLWSANIMFDMENNVPGNCILVDFQSYRYCPPAQDVISFIYLTTDREFRKFHMNEALDYYYMQLSRILKAHSMDIGSIVPLDQYKASCEHYKLFGIAQSVTHSQTTMMGSKSLKEFFGLPGYSEKVLFQDRSDHITKLCKSDPVYRLKMQECIRDLRELFESLHY